jgi:TRAP-type C4-dicarboxylate transport system substrate-binding protein
MARKEEEMKKLTRRTFLKGAGACTGMAFFAMADPFSVARAASPTYTGVTYLTPAYEDTFPPIKGFVDRLKKEHAGIMNIDFFDSGTLVKTDDQTAALRAGNIQFMFHVTSYITRTFPILGIASLPGTCNELFDHGERLNMETPLWKLMNDALAKNNTFMLTAGGGVYEPEYIWSGNNKITSLPELKGKRVRVVSFEAEEILKSYGAAGTRITSSELYLAIQRGAVDATTANISTVIGRKLHEQLKYCYKLPITAYSIAIFFMKDFWDKQPDKIKAAFWEAAKWYEQNSCSVVNKKLYPEVFWPRVEKAGIKIIQPTANEMKDLLEKSQPVWTWWKKEVGEAVGKKAIDLATGAI